MISRMPNGGLFKRSKSVKWGHNGKFADSWMCWARQTRKNVPKQNINRAISEMTSIWRKRERELNKQNGEFSLLIFFFLNFAALCRQSLFICWQFYEMPEKLLKTFQYRLRTILGLFGGLFYYPISFVLDSRNLPQSTFSVCCKVEDNITK